MPLVDEERDRLHPLFQRHLDDERRLCDEEPASRLDPRAELVVGEPGEDVEPRVLEPLEPDGVCHSSPF